MPTTLSTLEINIAKAGFGYATGAPTAGGSTTTLPDTSTDSPFSTSDTANLFQNAWLKIESDTAGTPRDVGTVTRITTYTPASQLLTFSPALGYTPTTTQVYGVYMGVPPTTQGLTQGIMQYINDTLRRLYYRRQCVLTLITDGDMETSGVTNWTASNSPTSPTLSKSTTTGITLGKQSLRVVNANINEYAQSATVNVVPGQTYNVAADVTVASGTATLQLYDVTNSESIQHTHSTNLTSRRAWFTAAIPSDCYKVAVQLIGAEASADIYWDNVTLINSSASEMPMPSWFKSDKWVESVKVWQAGPTSGAGTDRALDALNRLSSIWFGIHEDKSGYTPYRVQFIGGIPADALLVIQSLCPYDELTADASTTEADPDWIKAWVLATIGMDRNDAAIVNRWASEAQALDKMWQPKWEGKRYQLRMPY
jgi:hypothetical protein